VKNFFNYTENDSKVGNLARRLRKFFVWSERPLWKHKTRVKIKNFPHSQRSQKPIFESFSVYLFIFLYSSYSLIAEDVLEQLARENNIVVSSKQIIFVNYPNAFNPSIISYEDGFLLIFRYCPNALSYPWLSYIGIVRLNKDFDPIAEPELLGTRFINSKTDPQSEDARIFSYRGRLFVIYNDNIDVCPASWADKREIFIAELFCDHNHFYLSKSLKLTHGQKYQHQQKNWIPFEWEKQLFIAYTINPHEVLLPDLLHGVCYSTYETSFKSSWEFGTLRGSTPPILVDGEFLAFFHSGCRLSSNSSWGLELWHYFMGAYTFSAEPPFQLKKVSPMPIVGEGFYTRSNNEKRVIFPGGCVIADSKIYLVYGKDDCEIWVVTIDKEALKKSLVPVN